MIWPSVGPPFINLMLKAVNEELQAAGHVQFFDAFPPEVLNAGGRPLMTPQNHD